MEIKTTREIINKTDKYNISKSKDINWNFNTKWVAVEDIRKLLISLGYVKYKNKLKRKNINHLDVIQKLDEE